MQVISYALAYKGEGIQSFEMIFLSAPALFITLFMLIPYTYFGKVSSTSYAGSSLFHPRISTPGFGWSRVSLKQTAPTRVESVFFKKLRGKPMQIFSKWHELTEEWKSLIAHFFFKDRDAEKIYSLLSAAFQKHK